MRSFKVKQLTKYCQNIMLEVHLDAQKVQAVQVCQRLRDLSHYFDFDMAKVGMAAGPSKGDDAETCQVFQYETSEMTENFTNAYMPTEVKAGAFDDLDARKEKEVRVLDTESLSISNLFGIPSSRSLMKAISSPPEEIAKFK